MCPTPRLKADGERKCWLMKKVDKWVKNKGELDPEITDFKVHGFTLSQGLIIKLEVEFNNPLCCDITKCFKSVTYSLKNHHKELFSGAVTHPKLRGKKKWDEEKDGKRKTVEVDIYISVKDLSDKFEEIYQSITSNTLKCEVELKIPVIGEPQLPVVYSVKAETVSGALREYLMPILEYSKTTEGSNIARIAVDIYEGKDISIATVDEWLKLILSNSNKKLYELIHKALDTIEGIRKRVEGALEMSTVIKNKK